MGRARYLATRRASSTDKSEIEVNLVGSAGGAR